MKNFVTIILAFCIYFTAAASQTGKSPRDLYIEKFAPLAVAEMYRSGVPASITLAQGILESGNGQSELAQKANNHFGIKCHTGWNGGKYMYHDEVGRECYRKYSHPSESYRDHSDFIRSRDRYKFLFDYRVTDYKAWAYGLKKAGYATDPKYPKKLINLIEEYDLGQYDRKPASFGKTGNLKSFGKKAEVQQTSKHPAQKVHKLPPPPTVAEQVKELTPRQNEEFSFNLSRKVYSLNSVPFVYAESGDTYASIASSYNLFKRELLRFNDLKKECELSPGTVVYLKPKRNHAARGIRKYVFEEDDDLREVSQRFGVRVASLRRINGFNKGYVPCAGEVIRLR